MNKKLINKKEEIELEKAFIKGNVVFDNISKKELEMLQKIAKNTIQKTKMISIRVNVKTLLGLKAKAMEDGIPYQTLASSILHKSVSQYA